MAQRTLQLRLEQQQNAVADEVGALIAVIRPILAGTLFALKRDIAAEVGGYECVTLRMLSRLYRRGDGDCGICFEYAVHDALRRGEASVLERVQEALSRYCRVPGVDVASILFGAEKSGSVDLIETARENLTSQSLLLHGSRGRPARLIRHIDSIAAAFRRPSARLSLPTSMRGLWKADLFIGHSDSDRWVATSVKINPNDLESARGLRVGIVPVHQGRDDRVRLDDPRNLVICPLPYDGAFMEIFYRGWSVVQQFIAADAKMPREVNLPRGADRHAVHELVERSQFPILEVIEALAPLAQPELLETREHTAQVLEHRQAELGLGAALAPVPGLH